MHRLMRKLRRELSLNGHHQHLSEEEAMRQVLLQHALARQEEQERWQRLAFAEAEAQHQAALAAASMAPATPPFLAPNYAAYVNQATGIPQWTGAAAPGPYAQPMASLTPNVADEEVQVQRALEESRREEEERKRRQAAAEEEERRAIAQRQRESEEEFYRMQQRQTAFIHDVEHQEDEEEDEEDDEARRAALEEAKQVQLALQLSLAEQKLRARPQQQQTWDGLRAEGFADDEPSHHFFDHGGHHEAYDRRKGKEKVVDDDEKEDGGADDERELALRLSQLVHLPPEARAREEQAIYRAALINEQRTDMVKEDQKLQEQIERDRALALIARARNKEAALLPEPPTGTEGATELVVRMPDGGRTRRRFPPDATLQAIKDWVDVELAKSHQTELDKLSIVNDDDNDNDNEEGEAVAVVRTQAGSYLVGGYDLVTDFPRRAFTDMRVSASQAGLCPRALLNLSRKQ
ncbi:UBX domain containing protein [Acanthamoeba castellanii str. Neff]|uniref:UBX domain containing protein n=1 Tax=Acanthamoeba castellanii (strain ATCC 30010 / Neff) TaxID=1257118 RepID=L8HDP3_ACACF|nr:UBX domain containing protein [Acanthamoeba castellanii str. Neff]ELR23614.1 UBX domain containing protein [Acanthamoeba castellanii str. Neff]